MSLTRRDYEDLARDLNTVLRHSTPATIQSRADTVWLAANTISLTLKVKNPSFSRSLFYANVFEGFEQYRPHGLNPFEEDWPEEEANGRHRKTPSEG